MKCVVFDLDETLIDRHAAVLAFAHGLFQDFELEGTLSEFTSVVTTLDEYGYADREVFFGSLSQTTSLVVDDIRARFYAEVWETPRLVEGAVAQLTSLQEQNVALGIVTNGGTEAQRAKIRHSGLEKFFSAIVVSEEFGVKKPDATIYLEAARQLGVATTDSWFVGDHPRNDVWGSKQQGFKSAWIHLGRPWLDGLERCYDVQGATFADVMTKIERMDG